LKSLVVDASVIIKWYIPEEDFLAARSLRTWDTRFAAPDLLFVESANILWKLVRRGEIEPARAAQVISKIIAAPWVIQANRSLARDAIDLALATGISAYDASYIALAMRLDTICVTADQKLARKLEGTPSFDHVRLLADYAP
jgi:predicted nucleic acid-binding protein